ncbi:unnamed protein product [Strongylus vulgaris]|uniref:Uncharacterized protein n=1 Tax=Strongylus vulgaris TaxID=40348 RepID=A0A3P7JCE1_STRVU|nr:unnamed protein product [Strongylus vulgaris]
MFTSTINNIVPVDPVEGPVPSIQKMKSGWQCPRQRTAVQSVQMISPASSGKSGTAWRFLALDFLNQVIKAKKISRDCQYQY